MVLVLVGGIGERSGWSVFIVFVLGVWGVEVCGPGGVSLDSLYVDEVGWRFERDPCASMESCGKEEG